MSKPSKSPSHAKSSSSVGSYPPTARSLSLLTAEPPSQLIPTAMSNSVNTAIGATPSDFEASSGLTDTSAGSGRVSSAATTPKTARAPTSPEVLMNDLRKGSLFGRQSLSQSQEPPMHPPSMTNITFSSTNASQMSTFDMSTADQLSMKSGTSESTKTGIPMSGKSGSGGEKSRRRSPAVRISQLKLKEEKQKQLDSTSPALLSKKSKKSRKSKKSAKKMKKASESSGKSMKTGISQKSTKSGKLNKKKGPEQSSMDADFSKKSAKSKKSIKKADQTPKFGQSGVVKKGDNSVYLPGVTNGGPPANKFMKREESQKVSNHRKFNETPVHNFPGTGQCTRSMDQVAPPTSQNAQNQNHVVYDVAQLPESRRRVPVRAQVKRCDGRMPPKKFLFGAKANETGYSCNPKAQKSLAPAPTRIQAPTENKIVVLGKTPDGKTTVQMTIDMKVIAGDGLKGSDKEATLIPKKVIVGGKELKIDSESKSENGESPSEK